MRGSDPGLAVAWMIVSVFLYFLPGILAFSRKHLHAGAILALNFLLGWTILGWIVALVWSLMNQRRPEPRLVYREPPPQRREPVITFDERPLIDPPRDGERR